MAVISATFARSERLTADYYLNITRIGPRQRGGDAVGALPAAEKGAVGGREMLGRAGFAGEKQAVVDGRRQHGAIGGVAGQGEGIGTAREGVARPGRARQRV